MMADTPGEEQDLANDAQYALAELFMLGWNSIDLNNIVEKAITEGPPTDE